MFRLRLALRAGKRKQYSLQSRGTRPAGKLGGELAAASDKAKAHPRSPQRGRSSRTTSPRVGADASGEMIKAAASKDPEPLAEAGA
jgi:hypothetical protein